MTPQDLQLATRAWFDARGLTDAVVGYSGGVDSTLTAILLARAGLRTHLVVAEAPEQRYASQVGGFEGAVDLMQSHGLVTVFDPKLRHLFYNDEANEAALPIMRNACFYGVAAQLRSHGHKPVVVGTINYDEAAFLGFWGKASDGAQDFYPISHLNKHAVRAVAQSFGAPVEALEAEPSGDLLYSNTDDRRMVGASYGLIGHIGMKAEQGDADGLHIALVALITSADNPKRLARQIVDNAFKYELPLPGFHLSPRLEHFRKRHYPSVLDAAKRVLGLSVETIYV